MKELCAIISGGEFSLFEDIEDADYVIACDRGYGYACRCGVRPDLILGDFDSYPDALPDDIPVERLPEEKDDTDTMHAIRRALERGFTSIRLYCALGGRLDHLFANLQSAAFAVKRGASVEIIGNDCRINVISESTLSLPERPGWSLSVFSLTDCCRHVSIRGTKYILDDVTVTNDFPVGTSNEWRGCAEISAGEGILAVMQCRMPSGGPQEKLK